MAVLVLPGFRLRHYRRFGQQSGHSNRQDLNHTPSPSIADRCARAGLGQVHQFSDGNCENGLIYDAGTTHLRLQHQPAVDHRLMLTEPALHHGASSFTGISTIQNRKGYRQLLPIQIVLQTLAGQRLPLIQGLILVNLFAEPVQVQLFADNKKTLATFSILTPVRFDASTIPMIEYR